MRSCRKENTFVSDTPEQPNRRKMQRPLACAPVSLGQLVVADVAHNQTRVITDVLWIQQLVLRI